MQKTELMEIKKRAFPFRVLAFFESTPVHLFWGWIGGLAALNVLGPDWYFPLAFCGFAVMSVLARLSLTKFNKNNRI